MEGFKVQGLGAQQHGLAAATHHIAWARARQLAVGAMQHDATEKVWIYDDR